MVMEDVSNLKSRGSSRQPRSGGDVASSKKTNGRKTSCRQNTGSPSSGSSNSSSSQIVNSEPDSRNFEEKLKLIESEKGETEEVLLSLRGKLEEYRRLNHLKRLRLNERRAMGQQQQAATQRRKGWNDLPRTQQQQTAAKDDVLKDMLEKESQELEEKIKILENHKGEMEQTVLEFFRRYEGMNSVLQREKKKLEDDKDTTYAEMKGLLIEQHEESERLRTKVTKLERKRKKVAFVVRAFGALVVLALLGFAIWINFFVDDLISTMGGLSYLCAPARPGTQIVEASGPIEAPWWGGPTYTKELVLPWICLDRPRIRLEIKRGTLFITQEPSGTIVAKKLASTAYIETETLHISDRGGGHTEMHAPWATVGTPETTKYL